MATQIVTATVGYHLEVERGGAAVVRASTIETRLERYANQILHS